MNQIELLKEIIRIKSYSGQEGELAGYIKSWYEKRGAGVEIVDGNVVIKIEGRDHNRAFIFNSHMDTVSAGDETSWKYGPWNPTMEEKVLVGLGSSDMKSGLSASMMLGEQYLVAKPPVDMWFTYVVNEEVDGSGTESWAKWFENGWLGRYKETAAIFTEGTNLDFLEYGHRGNIFILAASTGDSGHASRPDEIKIHAVRKMIEFSDKLQEKMALWAKDYGGGVFTPPTVGVLTSIYAGVGVGREGAVAVSSPNKFPASCKATFDVRTVPGFHEKAVDLISSLAREYGIEISLAFPDAPSGFTDPNERIVVAAQAVIKGVGLEVSQGSADLGFLTSRGIKSIIFGPGEKAQNHMVDEYCYPDKAEKVVELYRRIVDTWAK